VTACIATTVGLLIAALLRLSRGRRGLSLGSSDLAFTSRIL